MKGQIHYLCLQATREGQASHAHVHEIIKGLREREWKVELFEPSYAQENQIPGTLTKLLEFVKVQTKLWLARKTADIFYIRFHFAAFPTLLFARLTSIPTVVEVNGPYEDLFISWPWTRRFVSFFTWLMRMQILWADAVIAVTPQLKSWVIEEVGEKLVDVIPNGANANLFNPTATTDLIIPKPYVVFFGAMAPWQGIDTMLTSVEDPQWAKEVKLVLVGDGVDRIKVETAAQQNLKIIYLGAKKYSEIPGIVAGSLAGLIPKNNQGDRCNTGLSPLKVYETLACGVPVAVTNFPGQADLVRRYECGIVVAPEDPIALAKAVAYLYRHPAEREKMGEKGRKAIEEEHSWDKRAAATEQFLLKVVNIDS